MDEGPSAGSSTASATAFDAGKRRLCPDGSCLGLVGPDGRCNLCGTQGEPGEVPVDGLASGADFPPTAEGNEAVFAGADGAAGSDNGGNDGDAPFDPDRRLCEDGACTGIIGADGSCAVCGRRAGA